MNPDPNPNPNPNPNRNNPYRKHNRNNNLFDRIILLDTKFGSGAYLRFGLRTMFPLVSYTYSRFQFIKIIFSKDSFSKSFSCHILIILC